MSATRTMLPMAVAVIACLKLASAQIPRPDTVFVPVPFDQLGNVRWTGDPDRAISTCGTFRAYSGTVRKVAGRWYTMYMSKIPSMTNHCSHLSNVQYPCRCFGIDFSTAIKESAMSFVMFSSNQKENEVTYEMMTATMNGKTQLNFYDIVMRGFVVRLGVKITGTGGFIIPNGVVVDSDDFETYAIMVFCTERAIKPIVLVLANALPMTGVTKSMVLKYLNENDLNDNLIQIDHENCDYARNIVIAR